MTLHSKCVEMRRLAYQKPGYTHLLCASECDSFLSAKAEAKVVSFAVRKAIDCYLQPQGICDLSYSKFCISF